MDYDAQSIQEANRRRQAKFHLLFLFWQLPVGMILSP